LKDKQEAARVAAPPSPDPALAAWDAVKGAQNAKLLQTFIDKYPNSFYAQLALVQVEELKRRQHTAMVTSSKALLSDATAAHDQKQDQASPKDGPTVANLTDVPIPDASPLGSTEGSPGDKNLTLNLQKELARVGCLTGKPEQGWGAQAREAIAQLNRYAKLSLIEKKPTQTALNRVKELGEAVCPVDCGNGFIFKSGRCVAALEKKGPTVKPMRKQQKANLPSSRKPISKGEKKKPASLAGTRPAPRPAPAPRSAPGPVSVGVGAGGVGF
jgi:hypothetical protein